MSKINKSIDEIQIEFHKLLDDIASMSCLDISDIRNEIDTMDKMISRLELIRDQANYDIALLRRYNPF